MQLICHHAITDIDQWRAAFDADDENRRAAGLSVMQIWTDADSPNLVFFLLGVNDKSRAQTWIKQSAELTHAKGTVTNASAYFVMPI